MTKELAKNWCDCINGIAAKYGYPNYVHMVQDGKEWIVGTRTDAEIPDEEGAMIVGRYLIEMAFSPGSIVDKIKANGGTVIRSTDL